jgi:hypothetical protein
VREVGGGRGVEGRAIWGVNDFSFVLIEVEIIISQKNYIKAHPRDHGDISIRLEIFIFDFVLQA